MRLCGTSAKFRTLEAGGDREHREPKNNVLNKQEGVFMGVLAQLQRPQVGCLEGGCGVLVSAWRLDLVRGSSGELQCQGDWVYGEMCPKTPQLGVCFGAVWEFPRDPLTERGLRVDLPKPRPQLSDR